MVSHASSVGLLVAMAAWLATPAAMGDTLFQAFSGSSAPAGWTVQGTTGTGHTDPGTPKTAANFFGSSQGYLSLTRDGTGYQRASAFFTDYTWQMNQPWTLEADIRIQSAGEGADGLTFAWIDAGSIGHDTSKLLGGYGEWMGIPRGAYPNSPSTGTVGYVSGVKGWTFEFDHYRNSIEDPYKEYTHNVDISTWTHYESAAKNFSTNPSFYDDNGWQAIKLEYDGTSQFTFYWGNQDASHRYSWTNAMGSEWEDCYFGMSASTGGLNSEHSVKNFTLTGTANPEPESCLLMALALCALAAWQWRQRGVHARQDS